MSNNAASKHMLLYALDQCLTSPNGAENTP